MIFLRNCGCSPHFDENFKFATMDLYTCKPNPVGLLAVRPFLASLNLVSFLNEFLLECRNNYFAFVETNYAQISFTAMSSSAAYSYLEEHDIHPSPTLSDHVKCWMHYMDVILFIWTGSDTELFAFVDFLDNTFTGMVFNPEISLESIYFLDFTITHVQCTLMTSIYARARRCPGRHGPEIASWRLGFCQPIASASHLPTALQPNDDYSMVVKFQERMSFHQCRLSVPINAALSVQHISDH